MKTTALALATLVALSGTAFAGQATTKQIKAPAAHAETTVKGKLDYATTGSVDQARRLAPPARASASTSARGSCRSPSKVPPTVWLRTANKKGG